LETVFNNLPSYAEKIADFVTDASAFVERQIEGEGSGSKEILYNNGLPLCKVAF
jgi:hypothetical protein